MIDNWIVVLNANTPFEEVYCVNKTPFNVVRGWAKEAQKEKNQEPVIISQKVLEMPEHSITIDVTYHAQ